MKNLIITTLFCAAFSYGYTQAGKAAHAGKEGIYVYNAFDPCSPSKPGKDGVVRVKVERRQQGTSYWEDAGFLIAPESPGQLTALYHRYQKYVLAKEFLHPEILPYLWESYKANPRWDSLGVYMNDRAAALAMGFLLLDTAALRGVIYEYQVSGLDKTGKVISSKVSNTTSWPDVSAFPSAPSLVRAEGDNFSVQIDWSLKGGKRPQFFKVFRKTNVLDAYELIGNQFSISRISKTDSFVMSMKDVSVAENQVYYYYVVAVDGYGNESKASDTVVAKTYNTKDLLLPQFFIARPLDGGRGVELSWKIVADQSVSGVEIFRSTKYDGEYTSIGYATGEDTAFIDPGAKPAVIYYYYMQITDRFQHVTSRSARTPVVYEDRRVPRKVRNQNAAIVNGKVQVSWTTIERNIAGYYVYRSVGMDTNYILVSQFIPAKDSVTVFIDESNPLTSPYGYSYVVTQENTSHVASEFSPPFYLESAMAAGSLPAPSLIEVQMVNGRMMITWQSLQTVSGVSGYNVLRRVNNTGNFEVVNTYPLASGTNFFTDSLVKPGNVYEYTVQVVANSGEAGSTGNTVQYAFEMDPLMPPVSFVALQTDKGVELSWDLVNKDQIKEVFVYRAVKGTKNSLKIGSVPVSTSTYTDFTAEKSKSYFYYLTSVSKNGEESEGSELNSVNME